MSKVQLTGNASGTGIFTIAAPNSNVDRTLTLPDNTGTLLSSASTLSPSQLGSQFSINSGAPSNSFVMDASGRITTPNQPAFLAGKTSATANGNVMVFNETVFNIGGHYNTSNGRFTAPISGVYQFSWQILGNIQQTVYRTTFRRNGSNNITGNFQVQMRMDGNVNNAFETSTTYTILVQLTAGDYVDIFYVSDNGVSTINDASYWEKFMGHLVG